MTDEIAIYKFQNTRRPIFFVVHSLGGIVLKSVRKNGRHMLYFTDNIRR